VTFPGHRRQPTCPQPKTPPSRISWRCNRSPICSKVRQGVKIAQARRADRPAWKWRRRHPRPGERPVEQLYWGLPLALWQAAPGRAARGRGIAGAEKKKLAQTKTLEARTALVGSPPGVWCSRSTKQLADLQRAIEMDLWTLPLCNRPGTGPAAAAGLGRWPAPEEGGRPWALAVRPGNPPGPADHPQGSCRFVTAGKIGLRSPSIAAVGGYANQTAADYIQPNIGYVGNDGATYTFVDWGQSAAM